MGKVDITGLNDLRGKLRAIEQGVGRAARREVKRAALNVQRKARQAVPVDTGRLRNSIAIEEVEGGLDAKVGSNVEYAPHVEFGTVRMRARAYLFPAMESERAPFRKRLNDAVDAALKEAAR